jgi:uncharacterized protein related to proFAR isomerase
MMIQKQQQKSGSTPSRNAIERYFRQLISKKQKEVMEKEKLKANKSESPGKEKNTSVDLSNNNLIRKNPVSEAMSTLKQLAQQARLEKAKQA